MCVLQACYLRIIYRYISLTFDGWTSKANVAFLAVTGHFIPADSDNIESVVLSLINASDVCHSGVEYAKKIRECVIKKFKFVENNVQIICCTTDNAGNMQTTAAELKIKNMPCYSHTMQLVVTCVLFAKMVDEMTIYK